MIGIDVSIVAAALIATGVMVEPTAVFPGLALPDWDIADVSSFMSSH